MNIKAFITLILSCLLLLGSFAFAKDDAPHSSRTESSFRSSGQYRINGDGTVTDTKTGLMWKRCSEGQSGDSCSGEATKYKWEDAMSKVRSDVSFAGHSDWRTPTIEELRTLVYCSNGTPQEEAWGHYCRGKDSKAGTYQKPTINQIAFPNTPAYWYWSSSPVAGYDNYAWSVSNYGHDNYAWSVSFNYGGDGWGFKVNAFQVRLVRSGQ